MRYLFFALAFFLVPVITHAASIYMSPASLTLGEGQTGTFVVYVESASQAMNAVSGTLSVDTTGIALTGASKASSIVSFWASEPTPNTSAGTLSFEGVVTSPGYTGGAGRILSFTVRAKNAGTYSARFLGGSVLANDGQGTDITSGTRGATVRVTTPTAAPEPQKNVNDDDEEPVSRNNDAPKAPTVRSEDFPLKSEWHAKTGGIFNWNLPDNVTAVRTLLDQSKSSVPSILLDGRVTSRAVRDIPEGINYLHVQFKNTAGWGEIAHVRLAIDTTPPVLSRLNEIARTDPTDPVVRMRPEAKDEGSGIARFEVSVDGGPYAPLEASGSTVRTSSLTPGAHTLLVRAVDEAGNASSAREISVDLEPLQPPIVTFVTAGANAGEPIVVSGTAPVPGTSVYITFIKAKEAIVEGGSAVVNSKGAFSVLLPQGLASGAYRVVAYVEDERGARSLPIDGPRVSVKSEGLVALMLMVAQVVGAIVALGAVIGAGIWLFLLLGTRIAKQRLELMEEIRETDELTRRAFTLLRKDVASYGGYLKKEGKKRDLTDQEQEFIDQLAMDLADSERMIRKELGDVASAARKAPKEKK